MVFGSIGGVLLPFFMIYAVFKWLIPALKGDDRKKPTARPAVDYAATGSYLNESQKLKVNMALRAYFAQQDRLTITGDINLRPKNGQFTTLRDLVVFDHDDQVASLDEFQGSERKFFNEVMDLLFIFSRQADATGGLKHAAPAAQPEAKPTARPAAPGEYDSAQEYIDRINALNNDITSEEISNGLYQITAYLSQIALIEKKFPEAHDRLKKVYHYYLPILVSILEQYRKFQDTAKGTADFKASEDKLTKTIILINSALKKITETVCANEMMNLNANMSTLGMLLKNDGLVDDQLTLGGKKGDGNE